MGSDIRPLISIVANFTRPTETKPSLLTFNELTTFLHEFGHALHGMLSKCTYESLSGTNVARDFVELPSQFMENFAFEKEWLDTWATHYQTGEKIPDEIIKKIKEASTFNEGYACYRQLGFGFLDMAWHTITNPVDKKIADFAGVLSMPSCFALLLAVSSARVKWGDSFISSDWAFSPSRSKNPSPTMNDHTRADRVFSITAFRKTMDCASF